MKSPRSSSALRTSALLTPVLLGLISCKPADSTPEAPKSSSAATPPATPAAQANPAAPQPAPAPATPGNSPESPASASPNPQKTTKQDSAASNAIPDNVLDSLLKQPKVEAAPLPPTVAIVEGEEIKAEELETALKTVLAGQGMQADQLPADQKTQGYKMLLNELITQKLVAARSKGFAVKDEEVNARIDQIKARFPNPEAFEAQVTKAGQTVDKLREEIRTSIRQQGWIEEQLKDAPKASDADAEDFYQKNPQQFQQPEQVRASHILVSLAKDAAPELVAEKQKAAQGILARVKSGEAFDKLAAELSEDPSAKQNSGDLNFFSREQMVPEFSTAAFSMKKGDISDPVRSQFGFHIIQVTDRKDAQKVTLESVKPQLLAFLNRQKHNEQVQGLLKDLREKSKVEIKLP
jgi:peptidyl-prolyl cis-trans isomerase C